MKIFNLLITCVILIVIGYSWYAYFGGKDQLSSLSKPNDSAQIVNATQITTPTTYYNDYLGVSYAIPQDWWLYELTKNNFVPNDQRHKTATSDLLAIISDDPGYGFINLISLGSLQNSTEITHLGVEVFAEMVADIPDLDAYMEFFDDYMLEPTDTQNYTLDIAEPVIINGVPWAKRLFTVTEKEGSFQLLSFVTPVKNNYYLTFSVSYWPEMTNGENIAFDHLSSQLTLY